MKSIVLIFFSVFILSVQISHADETIKTDESKKRDTTIFTNTDLMTGVSPITDSTNFEKYLFQNPTKALFKSMVVPGWGQYGNKKKLKALFFVSFDIWMISKAIDHKKKANDLWDAYNSIDYISNLDARNAAYNLYEQERNRRNKYTWYAVITSFFAMFDAYVDAHLSGFPKGKEHKFSIDILPTESSGAKVSLSLRF